MKRRIKEPVVRSRMGWESRTTTDKRIAEGVIPPGVRDHPNGPRYWDEDVIDAIIERQCAKQRAAIEQRKAA